MRRVLQGALDQISYTERDRPMPQILDIKASRLSLDNVLHVIPLAIRRFASHSIPFELGQNVVFCCGDVGMTSGSSEITCRSRRSN